MSHSDTSFDQALLEVPGFLFVDHVAISVPRGQLDAQVNAYKMLGFRELHREEVYGGDQVRESLPGTRLARVCGAPPPRFTR